MRISVLTNLFTNANNENALLSHVFQHLQETHRSTVVLLRLVHQLPISLIQTALMKVGFKHQSPTNWLRYWVSRSKAKLLCYRSTRKSQKTARSTMKIFFKNLWVEFNILQTLICYFFLYTDISFISPLSFSVSSCIPSIRILKASVGLPIRYFIWSSKCLLLQTMTETMNKFSYLY